MSSSSVVVVVEWPSRFSRLLFWGWERPCRFSHVPFRLFDDVEEREREREREAEKIEIERERERDERERETKMD